MEKKLKEDIVRAADSIRAKYRALKRGLIEEESEVKKRYEPIVKPLEAIIDLTKDNNEESKQIFDEPVSNLQRKIKDVGKRRLKKPVIENPIPIGEKTFEDNGEGSSSHDTDPWPERTALEKWLLSFGTLGEEYLRKRLFLNPSIFDSTFGVRLDIKNDRCEIGNKRIEFDAEDFIRVGDEVYHGSRGLFELLFMKEPDESVITINDKRKYKEILQISSAHKQEFNPNGRIASSGGMKYKNIIKPLFESIGRGILPVTDNKIDYIHWNDPNELVDRLALLIASERAGNNSHRSEIASIEEELREGDYIK